MDFGSIATDIGTGGISPFFNGDADNLLYKGMGLIPGVGTGRRAESDYENALQQIYGKLDSNWQLPEYDQTPLTPQEYVILTNYSPQIAAFVQQKAPQLLPAANNEGTRVQQESLNSLKELSKSGMDAGMQAQLEQAQIAANQSLRSNRANALQALANRGLGSSGATLGADVATSLGAAEQQRMAQVQAANAAAQRKANAISQLGNLGTQVAGQEQQRDIYNTNSQNQYNQLLANRQQAYNEYVAQNQNKANMFNQQQAQQTANANIDTRNNANMYNQKRKDQMLTNMADANNDKLRTIAGLQSGLAGQKNAFQQKQAGQMTDFFMNLAGMGLTQNAYKNAGGPTPPTYHANAGAPSAYGDAVGSDAGGGYVTDIGGAGIGSAIA